MRQLLVLFAMSFWAGQCLNAQADASYLRGKRIINPLSPSDTQGIGWDNAGKQFKPLSYMLQSGASNYCAPSGASTTTYTCSLSPAPTAYSSGLSLTFRPDVTNSGASTLNVNSLGAKNIQKVSSGALAAVASGDLVANAMYTLNYNGTVFVVQLGGGGSNTIAVQSDGSAVGTRGTINIVPGTGITPAVADTGTRIDITNSIDTAVVQTHANFQSGSDVYCAPSGASSTAYTCNLNPALTTYTAGMTIPFKPDVAPTGTPTLQINGLASPKTLRLADGVTTPTALHLPAGQVRYLWYDGTYFRVLGTAPVNFGTGGNASLSGPAHIYICTGACTITPPTPVAGYQFCVANDVAVTSIITLAGVASVQYGKTDQSAYVSANTAYASAGAAGDKICLVGISSTKYNTVSYSGTWN